MKSQRRNGTGRVVFTRLSSRGCATVLLLAALAIFPGHCLSSTSTGNPSKDLERELSVLIEKWHIPGMSFAVIRDGAVVWQRGLGVKNAQTEEPVNDETVFQAASMSKPVFAYAVLKMCDEGFLDLDTPLVNYAPREFIERSFLCHSVDTVGFNKEWFEKITARMALSHCSGLQHFALKKPVEMLFEPGTKFYYSSNGIEYLRHVVEHLKGERIDTLIAEYVFEPLNMKCSSFSWQDRYDANSAPGHDQYGVTSGSMERYPFPTAQASLYSNAQDYGKFLSAVLRGEGLKEETYREMIKGQIRTDDGAYWGLGFGLEVTPAGNGIWHWGDGGTHTCYFYGDLGRKSGFVYFVNSYYGLAILDDIFALLVEGDHPAPPLTIGDWSFREDYLSPSMEFRNRLFVGEPDSALAFYRRIAGAHEKGVRFIREDWLQYWAANLLQKGKILAATAISQLLIDAYYPARSDSCRTVVQEYRINKTDNAAAEFFAFVDRSIKGIAFSWSDIRFNWQVEATIAGLRPITLDERTLQSYAGTYGPQEIIFENGALFLASQGAGKFKMIPMGKRIFRFEELDYLRIEMLEENGRIIAAKAVLRDGRTKVFPRTL